MILDPPIFCALDVEHADVALEIAEDIKPYVGGYKVGPRLAVPFGVELIRQISEIGRVFVDNKYYDIPNTMETAVRATFNEGASFTTIHASAGPDALKLMAKIESELNAIRPFKIFAVTILTSFSQENLPPNLKHQSIEKHVVQLAGSVIESGLTGIVCSAQEVAVLRENFSSAYLVTPGVRFKDESYGDQKRVLEPGEAIKAGASAIVVGRPLVEAKKPIDVAKRYYDAVMSAIG